ncbi:MAG: RNA polymerase subunit sigma-70, partial [Planctomycetota bacterium]
MSSDIVDLADEELHARIMNRDSRALAEWIRRDEMNLSRFIRSLCSDRLLTVVEVEDLRQEVATAALTSLKTAPLATYTTQQWLQELARRRVVDAHRFHFQAQRRDAGRQQSMHAAPGEEIGGIEDLLAASFTSASAKFSRNIRSERLRLAIEQLGDDARNAIQLR